MVAAHNGCAVMDPRLDLTKPASPTRFTVRCALPGIELTVHIEPIEEKAAWEDSALLPIEKAQES